MRTIEEKMELQLAEHAWLVFMYDKQIVEQILFFLEHRKDKTFRIPKRYAVIAHDVVDYYNRWSKEMMI